MVRSNCIACRGLKYIFQHLYLRLQGVWCPLLAFTGTCTHMHTHISRIKNKLLDAILYVCAHMHKVPEEARRGHRIPWNLSYEWLWSAVWVLGIESTALNTESFLQPKYFFKMDSVSFQYGGLQAWLFVRNKKAGSQSLCACLFVLRSALRQEVYCMLKASVSNIRPCHKYTHTKQEEHKGKQSGRPSKTS